MQVTEEENLPMGSVSLLSAVSSFSLSSVVLEWHERKHSKDKIYAHRFLPQGGWYCTISVVPAGSVLNDEV